MIFPKSERKSHNSNNLQVRKSLFPTCNRLDHKYGFTNTVLLTNRKENFCYKSQAHFEIDLSKDQAFEKK